MPVLENEEGARVVSIEAIYLSCVFFFFEEDLLDFILVILRSHFMLGRASSIVFSYSDTFLPFYKWSVRTPPLFSCIKVIYHPETKGKSNMYLSLLVSKINI